MPSLLAASRVEIIFIPTTSVADSLEEVKRDGASMCLALLLWGQPSMATVVAIAFSMGV
jgi:hypothetical protein